MSIESLQTWLGRISISILIVLVLALAWLVAYGDLYRAGSTLGYNLGLTGGLMMLSLLLYPLRKRFAFARSWGPLKHWFRIHMIFGVAGPLLILFHSTFRIGSMNARVALYSMLLVATSGVVGRFVYRHIHSGLYGSKLSLVEAENELSLSSTEINAVLTLSPAIGESLQAFHRLAFRDANGAARLLRFVTLRWQGLLLGSRLKRTALKTLRQISTATKSDEQSPQLKIISVTLPIDRYIDAVITTSQFLIWERLFSLWHVAHIPFLYLLLFSGIVHVVAVHMY